MKATPGDVNQAPRRAEAALCLALGKAFVSGADTQQNDDRHNEPGHSILLWCPQVEP